MSITDIGQVTPPTEEELICYKHDSGFWRTGGCGSMFYYFPNTLEKTFQSIPLTKKKVVDLLLRSRVSFEDFPEGWGIGSCSYLSGGEPLSWNIKIDEKQNMEMQSEILLHEVIHAFYRVSGRGDSRDAEGRLTNTGMLEEMIDEKAREFYKENKEFTDLWVRITKRMYEMKTN